MDNYIEVRNLTKTYKKTVALDNLNLDLEKGKVYGLLGPNGSGKTTLLKSIAGLARPDNGEIIISGEKLSYKSKNNISFLADKRFLFDNLTAKDNLNIFADFYDDFDKELAERLMDYFSVDLKDKPLNFSKGDYKKLAICLVLSRDTDLYLLDEPTNGLDPISLAKVQDLLIEKFDGKKTFLMATHQIESMENLFEEVIFLDRGSIHHIDQAKNIRNENMSDIYDFYDEIYLG
ncbi:ABC transporter ATP-binding protein [Anaerococcus nagyae]|uniref:ABC transporter ATP-binding protein n=1 Tax=Anaerococcus nagyae TaxID=1755241 RepID=UPI001AE5AA61|nr:ABC transporter ATP-binding protein [Anaerococcus nagyae]MBP2068892.1 ABC-2 type transport system ATP-binding protein [Anaerococcus nagyae]